MRMFDRFACIGVAEDVHVELVDEGYWIEPVLRDHAIEGFDGDDAAFHRAQTA